MLKISLAPLFVCAFALSAEGPPKKNDGAHAETTKTEKAEEGRDSRLRRCLRARSIGSQYPSDLEKLGTHLVEGYDLKLKENDPPQYWLINPQGFFKLAPPYPKQRPVRLSIQFGTKVLERVLYTDPNGHDRLKTLSEMEKAPNVKIEALPKGLQEAEAVFRPLVEAQFQSEYQRTADSIRKSILCTERRQVLDVKRRMHRLLKIDDGNKWNWDCDSLLEGKSEYGKTKFPSLDAKGTARLKDLQNELRELLKVELNEEEMKFYNKRATLVRSAYSKSHAKNLLNPHEACREFLSEHTNKMLDAFWNRFTPEEQIAIDPDGKLPE
ncbi:MAG: hypothetical protein HYR96_04190 [Deltaproteobacteria bacterium]|nr:hypothetical protein [Deltaproteobacteria bacterium]MBI3295525.1 hypothetical protein [Deltaproteobacteria bacterium]